MKISGAIFDLDGTLLDSMYVWETIAEDYLLSRGITPKENLNEAFKTISMEDAAKYYQDRYGLADSVEAIIQGINEQVLHLYAKEIKAKPGVKELLEAMREQQIKMCIITAADRVLVEAALEANELLAFFEGIVTCTEVGAGKESAEIFEVGLNLLGTEKVHTIVFEDAFHAIKAAKTAGFKVAAVWDKSAKEDWDDIKREADWWIKDFTVWRKENL